MPPSSVQGTGVGQHSAYGPVALIRRVPALDPELPSTVDIAAAMDETLAAFAWVGDYLGRGAERNTGDFAQILAAAAQIAQDPALHKEVELWIVRGSHPAWAVSHAIDHFSQVFLDSGGYLAERVTDLKSIGDRVIARLLNLPPPGIPELSEPSIIVGEDISAADTAFLDTDQIVGLVTEQGGATSHTAIVAGQLGIACIVGALGITQQASQGDEMLINSATGEVILHPSEQQKQLAEQRNKTLRELLQADSKRGQTKDGVAIELLANISSIEQAKSSASYTVEGVGLLRTEVLYLNRSLEPEMAEQIRSYQDILTQFPDQKVVFRTLDAGADKPLQFVMQGVEENPALGLRGYRIHREYPHILQTQLAAIVAAAAAEPVDVWVMAPMISTPAEAREFYDVAKEAGVKQAGVMIEVPSAALLVDKILHEVDFISLGTNDLSQYTMAADRLDARLADLLDSWQPAVIGLVAHCARAGQKLGKPVGICGESAGDPLLALIYAGLGVTSLSMSLGNLPLVRYGLSLHTMDELRTIAAQVLNSDDPHSARERALSLVHEELRTFLV